MKIIPLIFLFLSFFISAYAQSPPIGIIDFYGLRNLSESQVRAALQLKEGDNVPDSKADVEKSLLSLPNVEKVKLNSICCDSGKLILYVGIQEKGAPTLKFRPAPTGKIILSAEIVKTAEDFYEAMKKATLKGDAEEDDSQGHSLMKNDEARAFQEKFIPIANQNLNLLRKVLHQSSNTEHRAIAAQIIAYYKDKKAIINDLADGINDESGEVRNNSMRALAVIARSVASNPKNDLKVPVKPFIDMLNSIEWTDRNKSSMALWQLTEKRDKAILASLRQNALTSLIEIARWKSFGHAFAGFCILARIANIPDDKILQMWENGEREKVIKLAAKS